MSFDTYAALQAEIQSFLWDRSDVVAKIPSFIQLAESEMKRELRTRQVLSQVPYTVAYGVGSIPCGYGDVKAVQIDLPSGSGTFDLDYATQEQALQWSFVDSAQPRFYAVVGDQLRFYPTPDQSYSGTMLVRSRFEPLSNTNRCNWVLKSYPDIYLAGALKWAKLWLIDPDNDWASIFYSGIESANRDLPEIQSDTKLRADELTGLSRRWGWNVMTDSYGGTN